jgi:hypothetical protein
MATSPAAVLLATPSTVAARHCARHDEFAPQNLVTFTVGADPGGGRFFAASSTAMLVVQLVMPFILFFATSRLPQSS